MEAYIFEVTASLRSHGVPISEAREKLSRFVEEARKLAAAHGFDVFYFGEDDSDVIESEAS